MLIFSAHRSGISNAEFFFKGHDQLDDVEAVRARSSMKLASSGNLSVRRPGVRRRSS